jgi:tetratricopeptide (TPR) repeat protein
MTEQARHRSRSGRKETPASTSSSQSRRTSILLASALALATLVVFFPVAGHEFVNYDDSDYVTSNPHVQSGLNWKNIAWAFGTSYASNWHPVTWLSHMLDRQFFGQSSGGPHLINACFHALNTVLLFFMLRQFTGTLWRSALTAAFFALHPLHVESVAWISERKDLLSGTFFLLTLLAYGGYARCVERTRNLHRRILYGLSLFCFALGLMSKPMVVTLPFVLLLLDYWPLQRLSFDSIDGTTTMPKEKGQSPSTKEPLASARLASPVPLIVEKAPFFLLSFASSIVTFVAQKHGGAVSTAIGFGARVANAMVAYARYLAKLCWPVKLSVLYPHPGYWPAIQVAAACVLLLSISILVLAFWRSRPYLLVGWAWFIGMLVPAIGLIQVGVQSMADRYTYLPLIGMFIMVIWAGCELATSRTELKALLQFSAGAALVLYAVCTSHQIRYWHDSEALFRHAIEVTKGNYLAYNNLGFYLSNHGKRDEAMEYYRKALAINPNYEDALNNLGYALAGEKKYAEAIPYYEAALRVRPDQVEVHNNLGNAFADTGKIDEAIKQYTFVLQQNPEHADAHNNLGIALAMQGKLDEAVSHFHEAIKYKPGYASAHSNLGNAFAAQHKLDQAVSEYQESLRLNPSDPQAHNNLGNVLAEQGKLEAAIPQYKEALRLEPNNPEAHYNLGMALSRQDKHAEALTHFSEAVRLNPNYSQARQQLLNAKAAEAGH